MEERTDKKYRLKDGHMGKAGYGTYFFFGSCCFAMFFFVWFLIPETKGMSLERMDDMYVHPPSSFPFPSFPALRS